MWPNTLSLPPLIPDPPNSMNVYNRIFALFSSKYVGILSLTTDFEVSIS